MIDTLHFVMLLNFQICGKHETVHWRSAMKRFSPLVTLFIVFLVARVVSAQSVADYYPLQKGSSWQYRTTPIGNSAIKPDTTKMVLWGKLFIGDKEAFVIKNEMGNGNCSYKWLWIDERGNVVLASLSTEPSRERAIVDFDPPMIILSHDAPTVGATWEIRQKTNLGELLTGTSLVESNRETVTVRAGTFRNCLKVKYTELDENGKEAGFRYMFFAKDVGIVLMEQVEPESRRSREELMEYSVK